MHIARHCAATRYACRQRHRPDREVSMKMRVGILTSGGDCPGLNATIRGVAKALYQRMGDKVEIIGILNGYDGLINGNYRSHGTG